MKNQKLSFKKAALISVYDKVGINEFALSLLELEYIILASGGTYTQLVSHFKDSPQFRDQIIAIEEYTKSKEILGGRVKTLHPVIHAGILAQRNIAKDTKELETQNIIPIDVVVVNLYPFEQTIKMPIKKPIKQKSSVFKDAIEHIDIGGVTLLRAAAKNHEHVVVVSNPQDYDAAAQLITAQVASKDMNAYSNYRLQLASNTFAYTAHYEATISQYLLQYQKSSTPSVGSDTQFQFSSPQVMSVPYTTKEILRYGENPHQSATLYEQTWIAPSKNSILKAKQLSGKQLSFNNIRDAEAAISIAKSFVQHNINSSEIVSVGIKHGNPCGVALGKSVFDAWNTCYKADTVSIFGGIVAISGEIDDKTALALSKIFLEIIIAPKYSKEALAILKKKKNLRLLVLPFSKDNAHQKLLQNNPEQQYISISGGVLVQDLDTYVVNEKELRVSTKRTPTKKELEELLFAWKVCKYVKSNAIALVKGKQTIGIGAGQMNRVGAAQIALEQAGAKAKGAVLASDAFFPMSDTVELAARHGIKAIIQPGGSIRDQESIDMCNKHGIAMVFTGIRHFLH